jgi:sulfate/thiosulfate transport system ATP-binding protein
MKVTIAGVTKSFGRHPALADVSVELPDGELVALLGPSGSGKTTLLRVIAGIESPDRGRIWFGDEDVTDRPVRQRNVGFVFQDYALFEHMTVADNIGFGPRVRGVPRRQIQARVAELLGLVQLEGMADRYPRQLSGGQRQRVALARALAPDPKILLLDEPFGALDARVRQELRTWLRRLHDEIGVTSVFVTHDQAEALEVADRLVIVNGGRIEQVGDPNTVFDEPASAFVMDFLGEVNVLHGHVEGKGGVFGALRLPWAGGRGGEAAAYIRSHDVALAHTANGAPWVSATVTHVRRVGVAVRVRLAADVGELVAEIPHHDWVALGVGRGDAVIASVRRARLFKRED